MKSVPNLISYHHEFFWNFSQFLAIYFELFSSGSKFNSENTDEWGPPVSRRFPRRVLLSACRHRVAAMHLRRSRTLSALSGPHAGIPTAVPTAPPLSEPHRRLTSPHACSSQPRRRPCLKLTDAIRARHRHCPATSAVASSSTVSGARAPSCRFSSVER
jgi:hypothetical protein